MFRIVAAAATLAAAVPAAAQQAQETQGRVGLGVGLPTSEIAPLLATGIGVGGGIVAPQLYVPINVTPNIRIEPQVGLLTVHDDASGDELSYKSIGTGVFWLMPLGGNADMYVGPRLVLSFFREKNVGGGGVVTETTGTDVFVAAALGGEIAVHPRFSVGAEGQLGYTSIGDRDVTAAGVTVTVAGGSGWITQGIIFARFYIL